MSGLGRIIHEQMWFLLHHKASVQTRNEDVILEDINASQMSLPLLVMSQKGTELEVSGYFKFILWLDKKYNMLALTGQELLSYISFPIKIWVCSNRSPLARMNHLCKCHVDDQRRPILKINHYSISTSVIKKYND